MVATIIGLLGPLLPGLIQLVQQKFGAGKEVQTQKKSTVQDIITVLLQTLAGAGKAPATNSDDISAAIEAVLAALKAQGSIPSGTTPATGTAMAGTWVLQGTLTPAPPAK